VGLPAPSACAGPTPGARSARLPSPPPGSTGEQTASGEVNDTRQDLTLADVYDGLGYVGSNPRDAQTGTLRANFYPEIFMLRSDASGRPVVTQVCDARGVESCAAATMTS
jgi:hypothetical protein